MKRFTSALAAAVMLAGAAPAVAPLAQAQPLAPPQNMQLPDQVPLSLPNVQSHVTGSSTGNIIKQHPGAPVPQPFSTDWLAGYVSDISAYKYGVYLEINRLFPYLKNQRPDVMRANMDIVSRVNNEAASNPALIRTAQRDAVASGEELLAELSPALGKEFGKAFRDALAENRLPKTQYLLGNGYLARAGGVASSTSIEKLVYDYPRPFVAQPQRIKRYEIPGRKDSIYPSSKSFPSGHTNQATWVTALLAYMVPEVAPQLHYRGAEAGYSRMVLGVHYPLDVIGGRMSGQAAAADRLNDPKMKHALNQARDELRREIEWRTGKPIRQLVQQDTPYVSTQFAVDQYTRWMEHDLPRIYRLNAPMITPKAAPVLLESSYPNLNWGQRSEVIRRTAGAAGNPLDWQGPEGSWQRINLAKAAAESPTVVRK
ncbi:acid phosphatase [Corynebacterium sp. BCW_4722]|nr:acid phosphatase [Corynebacterium sp. BCW_4722]